MDDGCPRKVFNSEVQETIKVVKHSIRILQKTNDKLTSNDILSITEAQKLIARVAYDLKDTSFTSKKYIHDYNVATGENSGEVIYTLLYQELGYEPGYKEIIEKTTDPITGESVLDARQYHPLNRPLTEKEIKAKHHKVLRRLADDKAFDKELATEKRKQKDKKNRKAKSDNTESKIIHNSSDYDIEAIEGESKFLIKYIEKRGFYEDHDLDSGYQSNFEFDSSLRPVPEIRKCVSDPELTTRTRGNASSWESTSLVTKFEQCNRAQRKLQADYDKFICGEHVTFKKIVRTLEALVVENSRYQLPIVHEKVDKNNQLIRQLINKIQASNNDTVELGRTINHFVRKADKTINGFRDHITKIHDVQVSQERELKYHREMIHDLVINVNELRKAVVGDPQTVTHNCARGPEENNPQEQ